MTGAAHTGIVLATLLFLHACTKDKGLSHNGNYPDEVARVILNSCATPGCHNSQSRSAAAGLSMSDWNSLMEGARSGPALIPYRPEFSLLCFYTNTYRELGPTLQPTMPPGGKTLSRPDYLVLRDWITNGAPDRNGNLFNGKRPSGPRVYVANQLCDVVTVLDGESRLPVRYIDVGTGPAPDFPCHIEVSEDGRHWYVAFLATGLLQKFSVEDNSLLGQAWLGAGEWSTFALSPDSRFAYCVDHSVSGQVSKVDLSSMKILMTLRSPALSYPRSAVVNGRYLCLGSEYGNSIWVANLSDSLPALQPVSLDGNEPHNNPGQVDPWVLATDKSGVRVFAGCASSGSIVEISLEDRQVTRTIKTGVRPAAMQYDPRGDKLWVSSMEDSVSFAGHKGSVMVIDVKNMAVLKTIRAGYQCNGLALVPEYNYMAVVNSNISHDGPEPHHVSGCGGRNGYMTFIDLQSGQLLAHRYELAVYPTAATAGR